MSTNGQPMTTTEERILEFVRDRNAHTGEGVSVPEICAGLFLTPEVAYRAVTFLVQHGELVPDPASRESKLELELAGHH